MAADLDLISLADVVGVVDVQAASQEAQRSNSFKYASFVIIHFPENQRSDRCLPE